MVYSLVLCPPLGAGGLAAAAGSWPAALSFVAFAVLCILIVTFRPENRIGWLCGAIAIGGALSIPLGNVQFSSCYPASGPAPSEQALAILSGTATFPLLVFLPMFTLLPLWFPNGQFLSPRWRAFWYVGLVIALGWPVLIAFTPGALDQLVGRPIPNPFELNIQLPAWFVLLPSYIITVPLFVLPLIANASLVLRHRRADAATRQQLKVFGFLAVSGVLFLILVELLKYLGLIAESFVQGWEYWGYLFVQTVGWLGYPTAIGVAVLKYRLYDIEVIIRKTLVYSVLTVLLALIYFGGVVLVQQLTRSITETSDLAIVVSTLVIAALFFPLRRRVQNVIDRRFYRRKYDAARTLAAFSAPWRYRVGEATAGCSSSDETADKRKFVRNHDEHARAILEG
jgi:hypothetical protein